MGRAGLCELASRLLVAAGGHVGLLPQGRIAAACDDQPDLRGHDALHVHCDHLHGPDVHLAAIDLVAAQLLVRKVSCPFVKQKARIVCDAGFFLDGDGQSSVARATTNVD